MGCRLRRKFLMTKKYYFIYKTVNIVNGMYYIGKHETYKLDDEYLGSGTYIKHAVNDYGRDNFEREILFYCDSYEELNEKEKEIVTIEIVNDKMSYNLTLGGYGSFHYINQIITKEQRIKLGKLGGDAIIKKIESNIEMKEKKSKISSRTMKKMISEGRLIHHHRIFKDKHHTEESKRKIGDKNKISLKGETNFMFGKCWVFSIHELKDLIINKNDLQDYLDKGWLKGRKYKCN